MMALDICLFIALVGLTRATDWSYRGDHGPEHWTDDFNKCGGSNQSPIDLTGWQFDEDLHDLVLENYDQASGQWEFENNGHSATMYLSNGQDYSASGGGLPGTYKAAQFHFHWGSDSSQGSEHLVNSDAYPLEMHIVHRNADYETLPTALGHDDGLAVIGIFFEISESDNSNLAPLITALGRIRQTAETRVDIDAFPLTDLMPSDRNSFYRYSGSLTTPTCDEVVVWTLFSEPVKISEAQMEVFRSLEDAHGEHLVNNFRPVQDLNERPISASFHSGSQTYAGSVVLLVAAVKVSLWWSSW